MYGSITVDDIINKIGDLSVEDISRIKHAIKLLRPSITRIVQDLEDWTWVYYKEKLYHIKNADIGYTATGVVIEIELEDSVDLDIDYDSGDHVLYIAENEKFAICNFSGITPQMIIDVSEDNSIPKLLIFGTKSDYDVDWNALYKRESIK